MIIMINKIKIFIVKINKAQYYKIIIFINKKIIIKFKIKIYITIKILITNQNVIMKK
jgi:hypothetical protein